MNNISSSVVLYTTKESIYNMNYWESYKMVKPCVEELYMEVSKLEKKRQIWK